MNLHTATHTHAWMACDVRRAQWWSEQSHVFWIGCESLDIRCRVLTIPVSVFHNFTFRTKSTLYARYVSVRRTYKVWRQQWTAKTLILRKCLIPIKFIFVNQKFCLIKYYKAVAVLKETETENCKLIKWFKGGHDAEDWELALTIERLMYTSNNTKKSTVVITNIGTAPLSFVWLCICLTFLSLSMYLVA